MINHPSFIKNASGVFVMRGFSAALVEVTDPHSATFMRSYMRAEIGFGLIMPDQFFIDCLIKHANDNPNLKTFTDPMIYWRLPTGNETITHPEGVRGHLEKFESAPPRSATDTSQHYWLFATRRLKP